MKLTISDYDEEDNRTIEVEFSKHDLVSLDTTLALIISTCLKQYLNHPSGVPKKDLEDMIEGFDFVSDPKYFFGDNSKIEKALQLFAKNFHGLWI